MNRSFGATTLQETPGMKMGCVVAHGKVSVPIEASSVCERAPWPKSESASLARRRPQSRWIRVYAAVHTVQSRLGRPRRGPTSGIPDRAALGHALELRALAFALRPAPARPNYALERRLVES
jgi:hypothetical protein